MREKAIEKLRKLVKAQMVEEAAGLEGAAQSYAAKIQELLIKHKLEFSDIDTPEEEEDSNPVVYVTIFPQEWGDDRLQKRVAATEELAQYVAPHYFCKALAMLESNCVLLVGRREDVDVCRGVLTRLMQTAITLCEVALSEEILALGEDELARLLWRMSNNNAKFRRSYLHGFNYRIKERLDKERKRIETELDCTALIRMTDAVDRFVDDVIKPVNVSAEDADKSIDMRAYGKGFRQAESVTIRPDTPAGS